MNRHALEKLALPAVLELVSGQAQSPLGVARVRECEPLASLGGLRAEHSLVREAMALLGDGGSLSAAGACDISPALEHVRRPGTHLQAEDLSAVAATIRVAYEAGCFCRDHVDAYPGFAEIGGAIEAHVEVANQIEMAISGRGEVLDRASAELHSIRRSRATTQTRLRDELDRIMRGLAAKGHLQDALHTIRGGRAVLPVKAEHRRQVSGIVHDRSASGETYFVEPARLVELGNELRELDARERDEILRILLRLTARVGAVAEELRDASERVARLDELLARARFAADFDCAIPEMTATGSLRLVAGRHPLLERSIGRESMVPLDLEFPEGAGAIVVTGPNAGGKTVALKTLGLLCLMAQTGLPIPAGEGTRLVSLREVHADIGDEQSLEANLSTFSAHVAHLAQICGGAGDGVLVLLDELGTGTDPEEGASLGAAILEYLVGRGARVLATTHLGALKMLAGANSRVFNAAMEFAPEVLAPTFRLRQGVPGNSYGIEIARKLGLPAEIVAAAESARSHGERDLAVLARDLEARLRAAEESELAAADSLARAEMLEEETRERSEAVGERERELRGNLAARVDVLAREARREFEGAVRELREAEASREAIKEGRKKMEAIQQAHALESDPGRGPSRAPDPGAPRVSKAKARARAKARVRGPLFGGSASEPREAPKPPEPRPLQVGDSVRVASFGFMALIESLDPETGRAKIRRGTNAMVVPLEQLEPIAPAEGGGDRGGWTHRGESVAAPSHRLDLRGQRVEDAESELDRFLDSALVAGLGDLEVVHGKGTGALRRRIGELLKQDRRVADSRLGGWNEGGAGVTIVSLRR